MKQNEVESEISTWTWGMERGRGLNWTISSLVESVGNDEDVNDVCWRKSTERKTKY
jgi:hypothetical protein